MPDGQVIDLILDAGVLSFDGRVVEAFGFSLYDHTVRAHVAKIESIEIDPGGHFSDPSVTFNSGKVGRPITAYYRPEQTAEIQAFVDAVRAAAPQLDT
jgi:hypothetical protein